MEHFELVTDPIPLPRGAFAKARRLYINWRGRMLTALSQSEYRAYLFPLYTPTSFAVTTESPIDHPHHNSLWIAADHIHCRLPYGDDLFEEATYGFYVNETFQGRAPGRIVATGHQAEELANDHLRIEQTLEWRGPVEWGAPAGRTIARETRVYDFFPGDIANIIDIRCRFSPTEWDLSIGPCRHAWFGARLAEQIRAAGNGLLIDAEGRRGEAQINGVASDWVDFSGTVGGGCRAGLALLPHPSAAGVPWYLADWGMLAVNPFARKKRDLTPGDTLELGLRVVIHDGDAETAEIAKLYEGFRDNLGT